METTISQTFVGRVVRPALGGGVITRNLTLHELRCKSAKLFSVRGTSLVMKPT